MSPILTYMLVLTLLIGIFIGISLFGVIVTSPIPTINNLIDHQPLNNAKMYNQKSPIDHLYKTYEAHEKGTLGVFD